MSEQPRETAGTTMRLVVDYVRRAAGEDGVLRMLGIAGEQRPLSVLEDERVWSSYAAKVALFAAAAEVTGQPDVGRRIGEGALESSVGGSLKLLLGLVGSPAQLIRGIARVNNKFSTAADMTALSSEPTSAVIRYQIRDGYPPHPQDCGYTMGLLTQVPRVFGLPPADVVHEVCQVDGADACLYLLRWRERPSRFRRRVEPAGPVAGLAPSVVSARLRDLQATVAELVAGRSVEEVLAVVTEHARAAVGAQRFLLATRLDEDRPPRINADGFLADDAERTAALLLADREPETGEHALVVPVRSMTRDYGRLAAFGRTAFFEHEHDLLRSYASLAATALDAITALDVARDRQRIAEVLLDFARSLLRTRDTHDVATTTASAARSLVDADAATVLLFDDAARALRVIASCGWPAQLQPEVDAFTIQAEDTEELVELLRHPDEARVYDRDTTDPWVRKVLEAFDTAQVVATPLRSAERLWGLVLTSSQEGRTLADPGRLFDRLSGLADQAVAALDRAALTEQVHRQATEDMLTGLANRRAFTDRLERLL
ncbi:MAG: GAF domain-containing protein, partial [Mycobacteriaceae bacterium]